MPTPIDRVDSMTMLMHDVERYRPAAPKVALDADRLIIADLSLREVEKAADQGAEIFEDIQFGTTNNLFSAVA